MAGSHWVMSLSTNAFELLVQVWPELSLEAASAFVVSALVSRMVMAVGSKGKLEAERRNERRVMERLNKVRFLSLANLGDYHLEFVVRLNR